ncbi:MAG: UvrD-helicase domain-containing protein, partial [Solirubrobacterales bacterium]|nr:UvrD-helicase domain-containing protein [Solirubrobacterales bacterium]
LAAGIDPGFVVLDRPEAERLADVAFEQALTELAASGSAGVDLIAAYTSGALRGAILATYAQLRSRGALEPRLPPLPAAGEPELARELARAASELAAELGAIADPGARVIQALERLERCRRLVAVAEPWPAQLDQLSLPGGNGAALSTEACGEYSDALARFRLACERRAAGPVRDQLDRLLVSFGAYYARHKRAVSGLDFEDLELITRELLGSDGELRERYAARFERIMVDELQDTNRVQLELIESIARGNLFTVGDAQQSIYGFRHAQVELFEARAERLAADGARATLTTNFRSRPEILEALNGAFEGELGERFMALAPGRDGAPAHEPRVELLVVDKGADWASEGLVSPWRVAEARSLADRVAELLASGAAPREVVVLMRATTDMRAYERALEERGVPTYVIGGRGYWSHPQVIDLVAYLRALANPRDEEALYTVLASPLVGVSLDSLVVLAAAAREREHDPWRTLREPDGAFEQLATGDRDALIGFASWFADERVAMARLGIEQLLDRALERTGYDLAILAMPGGERRLANVRKLMRLGREFELRGGLEGRGGVGVGLRGFLELVRARPGGPGDARESEAPVEGEALDAVRVMTIHRAKGLEFEIVCVADLGRVLRRGGELLRLDDQGRLGLRLAQPGTGKQVPALHYKALGEARQRAEEREERRLFYVAMTRARERLILSGAAKLEGWEGGSEGNGAGVGGGSGVGGGPISWVAPAFVPELGARIAQGDGVVEGRGGGRLRLTVVRERASDVVARGARSERSMAAAGAGQAWGPGPAGALGHEPAEAGPADAVAPVASLSYSSLGEYARCGYRFYVERVLAVPPVAERGEGQSGPPGLSAADRGVLAHALLERLDFRRPGRPSPEVLAWASAQAGVTVGAAEGEELAALVERFGASETCTRLAHARELAREKRFGFLLDGVLITGVLDVIASKGAGRSVVVDYKSDRLEGADPEAVVRDAYGVQRLVYALAALRAGAQAVEVVHLFLERPGQPVARSYTGAEAERLAAELAAHTGGVLRREFEVAQDPHRGLCGGCPAEGGLCCWP